MDTMECMEVGKIMRTHTTTETESDAEKLIEISYPVDDFVRNNKAMLKLMSVLLKYHPHPIPTRRLYDLANTSNNYGGVALCKAERMGYITRKRVEKPIGERGNHMILNSLTLKGERLLQELGI